MKKYILLLSVLPLFAMANDYHYDQNTTNSFSAEFTQKQNLVNLLEKVPLKLLLRYPKGYTFKECVFEENADNAFQLLSHEVSPPKDEESDRSQEISFLYEPQLVGHHYFNLPILHFESEAGGDTITMYPKLLDMNITSTLKGGEAEVEIASLLNLEDRAPVEISSLNKKNFEEKVDVEMQKLEQKEPLKNQKLFKTILIIMLCLYPLYKLYKYLMKKGPVKKMLTRKEDPRLAALKALKKLKSKGLPLEGLFEAFYVEVTQIVREYIEKFYKIKAPEQTTQEFLQIVLSQNIFEDKVKDHLSEFLKFADLVKFARLQPQIEDCDQTIDAAHTFILNEHEELSSGDRA